MATNSVLFISSQIAAKKAAKIEAKLVKATDPKRKAALVKLLKTANKVAALKEKLAFAAPAQRKAIKAKLVKA